MVQRELLASETGSYTIEVILALPADGPSSFHGGGGGLIGEYFSNAFLSEPSMLTRVDTEVAFDWLGGAGGFKGGQGFPVTPTKRDGVSARWTGFLKVPIGEAYTFTLEANDGARLYIDGKLVVAAENGGTTTSTRAARSGTVAFEAGVLYRLRVEMQDRSGRAAVHLYWQSDRTPRQLVPSFFLYPSGEHISGSPFPLKVFAT
jgi:hypothetical protein